MYGICAFPFIATSFIIRESGAILTLLSFFTVNTAGLTKQSSVISVALSRYPISINRFKILLPVVFVSVLVLVVFFVV